MAALPARWVISRLRTLLMTLLALTGCQTTRPSPAEDPASAAAAFPTTPDSAGAQLEAPAPEAEADEDLDLAEQVEPDLRPEDYTDEYQSGFCPDDIYVRYL